MTDETIRSKIKEIIQRVANCGPVHEYSRWTKDWKTFLALFQEPASKRILGWEVCRRSATGQYISNAEEEIKASYMIRGYMGLMDADRTDILFNTLIEQIRDQFRLDKTMGGVNDGPQGFNVQTLDERFFGDVLCHYCEIIIPIQYITT